MPSLSSRENRFVEPILNRFRHFFNSAYVVGTYEFRGESEFHLQSPQSRISPNVYFVEVYFVEKNFSIASINLWRKGGNYNVKERFSSFKTNFHHS